MSTYTNLNPLEFKIQIKEDPNAVILDVRTPAEYRSGHLEGSVNVPNIKEELVNLDVDKHYYVHCRIGGRSAIASLILSHNGFKKVFNLNGELEDLDLPLIANKDKINLSHK